MSPRPVSSDGEAFEPALELAGRGLHAEAIDAILTVAARSPDSSTRRAAVVALTAVARGAESRDPEEQERALREALQLAPGYPDLHHRLACAYLEHRRFAQARASLEHALRLNPGYVAAHVELALLDAREGRLAEALDALRRLGREARISEPREFGRGIESLAHADWDQAGILIRGALGLDEPEVEAAIAEYHTRMRAGDRAGAARLVRSAVAEHGGYADLHYLLGVAELEDGHLDDAIASLARALELHSDFHAARLQLARVLEAQGDVARARDQVSRVLEADPQHAQALEMERRWSGRGRRRRATGAATPEPDAWRKAS